MVETVTRCGGEQDPTSALQLWTFMTMIQGVSDEHERARLMATGIPSLLPCRVSGVALLGEGEPTWRLVIQKDGRPLDLPQAQQICTALEPLFQSALEQSPILITSVGHGENEIRNSSSMEGLGIQTLTVAPLRTIRHQIGIIMVGTEKRERFSREEETVISTLAEQSAIGIENLRLNQTLNHYAERLQHLLNERTGELNHWEQKHRVLLEINNAIIVNLDRETLLRAIAETLRNVLPFDRAALTLLDSKKKILKVHALTTNSSVKRFLTVGMEFPLEGSPLEPVYTHKRPYIRLHLEEGQRIGVEEHLFQEGIRSYVLAPLMAKGVPFGTLNLGSREPEDYSAADADFLAEVAQQVALAIENMLAYEEIAQLKSRLEQENRYLQEEISAEQGFGDLVGKSTALRKVLRELELVAPTDATVLVLGESGTGKELLAREIHKRSARQAKPLIRVNCASIPRELYESEFFGHTKGSFTGAVKDRAGRFEVADGGTLFLDEVGEIPLDLQSKLLRVLQEQQYERVGDERTRQVDVRVIAATNRNLEKEVEVGRFRQDLYYRLNVYPIEMAPLRKRPDDIPLLAAHLSKAVSKKLKCPEPRVQEAEVAKLQRYQWPGNVRELQNVIERAVITSRGTPLRFDLPVGAEGQPSTSPSRCDGSPTVERER